MKAYLGDSVYIESDGIEIRLFTNNGAGDTNSIFLDETVVRNLVLFLEKVVEIRFEGEDTDDPNST